MNRIAALALLATALPAFAAGSDDLNVQGDKLSFPVDVPAKIGNTDRCIPAKTPLRGMYTETDGNNKTVWVRLGNVFGTPTDCKDGTPLPANVAMAIDQRHFTHTPPSRYGLTYGALVVPFKYHVKGSKEFKGGSTVAPYFGYRSDGNDLGFGAKFIGFLGASTVAVEQEVGGKTQSQNLAGFSYGLGVIGQVKSDFQMGLVIGAERISKSARYADNGKMWLAVSLGFDFAK